MIQIKTIFTALFVVMFFAGCASKPSEQTAKPEEFSGYLGDYSNLTQTTDETGQEVLRYVSPRLKPGSHTKIIIDNIVFYPPFDEEAFAEQAGRQVTKEALIKIRDYSNEALRREVGKVMTLTNQPGPGVLRIRVALTGVITQTKALKPYEYIPVGLVIAGLATAVGERDKDAYTIFETEVLESATGERLAMEVLKRRAGERLKDKNEELTADHVRELIDTSAAQTRLFFEQTVGVGK